MSEPEREITEKPSAEDRHAEDTLVGVLAEMREILGDLFELSQLQFERARIGVRAGLFNAGLATWAAVVAIATTIVAAYFFLDGLAGGLSELLGTRWAGRLGAGVLVFALTALIIAWARHAERRANLERLRRKFPEEVDDERH